MNTRKSIGESRFCDNHPTKSLHLNEINANKLATLVASEMKWPKYSITYTHRDTKRVNARVWRNQHRVIVNTNGECVCTVLHELAHHVGRGHDWTFKSMHLNLLRIWEEKWQKEMKSAISDVRVYKSREDIDSYEEDTHEVKVLTTSEVNDIINQVVTEIVEEIEDSFVTTVYLGKKLLEFKINNFNNMTKAKALLAEYGVAVKFPERIK
jgi:hypothetical protein